MILWALWGCTDPWSALAERERHWWQDAGELERIEGIDLVELRAGEPLGYWPRVVLRADRISIDNRAALLALDPDQRATDIGEQLVERSIPAEHTDTLELPALREAMQQLEAKQSGTALDALPIVVVPDARAPVELLTKVLFTILSHSSTYTLAGAADGRLRGVLVSEVPCAAGLLLEIGPDEGSLSTRAGGVRADEACPMRPGALVETAGALAEACAPLWDRSGIGAERRCFDAMVLMGPGMTAADLLGLLGRIYEDPRIYASTLGKVERMESCEGARPVAALDAASLRQICETPAKEVLTEREVVE